MTIQTLDCVCGGNAARPNHDCERCQLLAEIERLTAELAEARKDTERLDWLLQYVPDNCADRADIDEAMEGD